MIQVAEQDKATELLECAIYQRADAENEGAKLFNDEQSVTLSMRFFANDAMVSKLL